MALIKCKECGKEFSDMAAACPNCGYNPSLERKKKEEETLLPEDKRKSKITAGFLCLFLWGFGAHEFYLGNVGNAIAWIIIGGIAAIATATLPILALLLLIPIIYAVKLWTMPQDKFDLKYNQITSPKGKLGCLFGVIVGIFILLGLMMAAALPQYKKAVEQARTRAAASAQY